MSIRQQRYRGVNSLENERITQRHRALLVVSFSVLRLAVLKQRERERERDEEREIEKPVEKVPALNYPAYCLEFVSRRFYPLSLCPLHA